MSTNTKIISIILPIHNGSRWIDSCFRSILKQSAINNKEIQLELCVCNDSSTDNTSNLLEKWKDRFGETNIMVKIFVNTSGTPGGVGYAKNKAVSTSTGKFLCFQDIDDIMLPERIQRQYEVTKNCSKNTIVGCQFERDPKDSTIRYTKWANSLTQDQLNIQVFTSNGPTIIMPTWFIHKSRYDQIGGFVEDKKGTPEDLVFFYKHLDLDGKIQRVDECLLIYTFHVGQTSFSIHKDTIWNFRVERLQKVIINKWTYFTIWNAGKQGRKLYNYLTKDNQIKVAAFCDVDEKKIGKKYMPYDPKNPKGKKRAIEIIHFKDALPPLVICIKMDMTGGVFEENLKSLNLREGIEYILFS